MPQYEDGCYNTIYGDNLIGKVLAGRGVLEYTRAAIGSGQIPAGYTPKTMKESAGYVMDGIISEVGTPNDGECQVVIQIKSDDVEESFYATNVVLFANDPDEDEIAFAYLCLENQPEFIHSKESIIGKFATFNLVTMVGDIETVDAVINPDAIATVGQVSGMFAEHDANINAHNTKEQLNNLLLDSLFDSHTTVKGFIESLFAKYPNDTGLIDICTFWKAKISAEESLWNAKTYKCTYNQQTIKALFIDHPDEPTSALDGVYQVLELPSTDSFTATIKLTFYAQVRDDDTPESTTFTIRPYISNTLAAVNGTDNGVTIPNDGAWHKVEVQGTVSNGTIYVVLDSFPAAEAAQHWFYLAMPKAEIISLSDGTKLLQTAKDAYLAKIDADLRTKIADDELYRAMLNQELEMTFPRFPVPTDIVFVGTQASGVVFNTFANLLCTVITGYITSMPTATISIGVVSDKYIGDIAGRAVRYYKDGKWHVGSIDIDSNNQITVTASALAQEVQFSILLSRDYAEDSVLLADVLDLSNISIEEQEEGHYFVASHSFTKTTSAFGASLSGSVNIQTIPQEDAEQFKIKIKQSYRPASSQNITASGQVCIKNKTSGTNENIDISNINLQIKTDGGMRIANIDEILAPYNNSHTLLNIDVQFSFDYIIA